MNVDNRTLFIADNLDIMRGMDSDTIDLIYLDPPFNSKKEYKAPIGSPAEGASFKDIWTDEDIKTEWHGQIAAEHEELYQIIQASETVYDTSMKIYLTAMAVRLFEMHRILKPTGSIYLHCDPTASHYLKLIMDSLFGQQNFRNEIIGCYTGPGSPKMRQFNRKHDSLFWYSKGDKWIFNREDVRIPHKKLNTNRKGAMIADALTQEERDAYLKRGKVPETWWPEFSPVGRIHNERTGYPTQKTLALLNRIIRASSDEGDIVLDPFCGCATECVAAESLQRQWVGIDISPSAEVITKLRLDEASQQGNFTVPLTDVIVRDDAPERTDNAEEIAVQMRLPTYQTHKPELFGRQQGKCNGCQCMFHYRNLTVDHIRPQIDGGTDHIENLQLLCAACNSTKGTGTQEQLIERLKEQGVLR